MYVRKEFNNLLPHPETIRKWYKVVDGEPGFTQEAFDAIFEKNKTKQVFVNLTLDEMSIRQLVQWDGKNIMALSTLAVGILEMATLKMKQSRA